MLLNGVCLNADHGGNMGVISQILGTVLGWIMWLVYKLCGDYALSIVIFTLITKIILFPISVKTQKNSAAMAAFSPKLEKLKKQYANNPQKLQEAQMALYEEEGINPMASCLPMVIQLFVLYGIFDVVYRPITHILRFSKDVIAQATEICQGIAGYGDAKYFVHRPELYIMQAVKDPACADLFKGLPDNFYDQVANFKNNLFGFIDLGLTPTFSPADGWTAASIGLVIIPFVSGIVQLIMTIYQTNRQKKLNPDASQSMGGMNAMLYIMPVFSVWIAFSYPAGIGFYWAVSSIFSFIQSIILYKVYTPEYVATLIEKDKQKRKKKNKPSMMQKYQQMMAEQNGGTVRTTGRTVAAGVSEDEENTSGDVKVSRSQQKEMELKILTDARKHQNETYGIDPDNDTDASLSEEERKIIEEARRRQAEKYGDK